VTDMAYLKRAAVLLLHPDPERFVTGAPVKVGFLASESDLRYHDEVTGDVWVEFPFSEAYLASITGGTTSTTTQEITPEVERLLLALEGEMSRADLMSSLDLRDEKHFREHYLQVALVDGLIEMTRPDRPRSRLQKYRFTERGRVFRSRHRDGGRGP